jgi:hypothetical protein
MPIHIELSLDSLVACMTTGVVVRSLQDRVAWVAVFGVADALASLAAGLGFGTSAAGDNLLGTARPIDALPAGVGSAAMAVAGLLACSFMQNGTWYRARSTECTRARVALSD